MPATPTQRLARADMQRLASLLLDAFDPPRFDEFLLCRLDRHSYNFAGASDSSGETSSSRKTSRAASAGCPFDRS